VWLVVVLADNALVAPHHLRNPLLALHHLHMFAVRGFQVAVA
jgi:hypothetical protein